MQRPRRETSSSPSTAARINAAGAGSRAFGHETDLLEIYHARQIRDSLVSQLKRLRASCDEISMDSRVKRQAISGYYKALLLTTAELLQELGDDLGPSRS